MTSGDNTSGDAGADPDGGTERDGGIDRRSLLAATGTSAVAAALAGCSAILGGDGDGDGGVNGDATGTITTDPLNAGLLTFTQGAPAVLGIQAQRGAELAQQRINENGGIAGQRQLNLEVANEGVEDPVSVYEGFIDDGKDVTFGPISSGTHASLAPIIEENEVVNVGTDGTVTTLYEEGGANPDPTYSFRFQNYDVMETVVAARDAVRRRGADNISSVSGMNPNYSFGQDEYNFFTQAMSRLVPDAEILEPQNPDLGAGDMSSQISAVQQQDPDVIFTSFWGGDVTTFLQQGLSNGLFEGRTVSGTILYSAADDLSRDTIEGVREQADHVLSGSRNFYWGTPDPANWPPGQDLLDAAGNQEGITLPTAHYMSGYGAVTAWATAVEKAIDILGGNTFPSQEQIAATLEGHGFFTPAGYHVMAEDHQGMSNAYSGDMGWSTDVGGPVLTDVNTYAPKELSPPPGVGAEAWIDNWG